MNLFEQISKRVKNNKFIHLPYFFVFGSVWYIFISEITIVFYSVLLGRML